MSITNQNNQGRIIVFTGPMFSGKTTALINKYEELTKAKKSLIALKPIIDNRYSENAIVSHNKHYLEATKVNNLRDVKNLIENTDYIFIDEAQFFPRETVENILSWKAKGKNFIIAGLDTDYLSNPFGIMPDIINIADETNILQGKCDSCNKPSTNTFRKNTKVDLILIGEKAEYAALCKSCFLKQTKHYENIS